MHTLYLAADNRYQQLNYRRCGNSGLHLPEISLGLWHNFGGVDLLENAKAMVLRAFDRGVTHFDLANNYGPPFGSAEETFGLLMERYLRPYRDELVISTKAGYRMWPGPYGEWGSRKYLISSLDQSLRRMKLDYVDIFYSHRFDPNTPLEETLLALDHVVRQGKALYVGISSYSPADTQRAIEFFRQMRTPFVIHQPKYNMLAREPEYELLPLLGREGIGSIVFSPLAQGMLTDRYLHGIPEGSRAARPEGFLQRDQITDHVQHRVRQLHELALQRGQSLAQMAIAWLLRLPEVTSVLIGASSVAQLNNNLDALHHTQFSPDELTRIEQILAS